MVMRLDDYIPVVGMPVIEELHQLGQRLKGLRVVHVNSTREGGGVAEILQWMTPLMQDVGMEARWEVIQGSEAFFPVTKAIHNGLQGHPAFIKKKEWDLYEDVNRQNFERLRPVLEGADMVVIHDPQPAFLHSLCPKRHGKWIWRAHIDISRPYHPLWKSLQSYVSAYDASIFSISQFARVLPHPQFIIAPSIDPLSEKNRDLTPEDMQGVRSEFGLDPERPIITQISRFDRFKDPLGVIQAYRMVHDIVPVQLVLAGGGATDDPEGEAALAEVMEAADTDPDIHILQLPPDAHKTVNALQRLSDIIVQKSTKEGFGLTVTEGLWKGKPVIGGDVGGIRLQVINHYTGYLVNTPEGLAHRIRYLLHHPEKQLEMGSRAKEFVRENFLLTRHLRSYLILFLYLMHATEHHTIVV